MKAKTKTVSKISKKQKILVAAGAVAALAVVAYLFLAPVLEKRRFENAASELETLAGEIQAKIGPADEIARDKSCGRAHLKNDRGPLTCDVGVDLLYENVDSEKANSIMLQLSQDHGKSVVREGSGAARGTQFVPKELENNNSQIFYQDLLHIKGLPCALGYTYPVEPSKFEAFRPKNTESLKVGLTCGGSAHAEHYRLRD